jgi:hypothetical protein
MLASQVRRSTELARTIPVSRQLPTRAVRCSGDIVTPHAALVDSNGISAGARRCGDDESTPGHRTTLRTLFATASKRMPWSPPSSQAP